ncbi:exodeoxyribonuclease VII large subunit [Bacillaceae bacterium Marseille-Q3522]|nr:exodeoxyribonuclease VII large subunit [Bacillaceae bacterium Marseille-Q3522]
MQAQRFLTVSALTKYIKRKFDADPYLQNVYVKGEISNFKQHSSGHMYFTLKDEKARLSSIMFSSQNRLLKFIPENGMKVVVCGDVTVYEANGSYQMYVNEMQPDGMGQLYLAYEQLKEKLEKEGFFLSEHKKTLPKLPQIIAIITSPTGAAIRDIITTLKRRYPIAKLLVFPALVQGEQAGSSIVKAIEQANNSNEKIDLLIIGRGGGSIEELWAFNEEQVARAIFASNIPIISAVGHETDFTIADFVADVRAPTPTGAAEMAAPHIDELMEKVLTRRTRLMRAIKEKYQFLSARLERIEKSYAFRYPYRLYTQKLEQVDRMTERFSRLTTLLISKKQQELQDLQRHLRKYRLQEKIETMQKMQMQESKKLTRAMQTILTKKQQEFVRLLTVLEALSPLKIMERGFSLTFTEEGRLIKSITEVNKNDKVEVKLINGSIACRVIETREEENSYGS